VSLGKVLTKSIWTAWGIYISSTSWQNDVYTYIQLPDTLSGIMIASGANPDPHDSPTRDRADGAHCVAIAYDNSPVDILITEGEV
jgi:hypothetical protein